MKVFYGWLGSSWQGRTLGAQDCTLGAFLVEKSLDLLEKVPALIKKFGSY
jgi:hypothetical protein